VRPSPLRPLRWPLLWLLFVATGCLPVPTYRVQRTVRVPHPAVPLRTGQPLAGPVEVTFGMSNVADVVKPAVGNDRASVEVPSLQARGELRIRIHRGEIALVGERAFGASSQQPDPLQAPVGDGDASGGGFAVRYAVKTSDPRWSVGLESELVVWNVPSVEYRTCVSACEGQPLMTVEHRRSTALVHGFGITPSFRSGALTLFGGVYVRNHPTVERKGSERGAVDFDEVSDGPENLLLDAGLAYLVTGGISVLATISQDVTADPVRYGPGLGIGISAALR
jgi:hypothetical protein